MQILLFLQSAFSVWMLVDAYKRGAVFYWYAIILFPFGEWIYFFTVKIHDPEFQRLISSVFAKKVGIKQLRYNVELSSSFENKRRLAEALLEERQFEEAGRLFQELNQTDKKHKEVIYGMALCSKEQGQLDEAGRLLEHLIEENVKFLNYEPYVQLCKIYARQGKQPEVVALFEKLIRKSERVDHRLEYAKYLLALGEKEKARAIYEVAVNDYKHSTGYVKRQYRIDYRKARRLFRKST